MAVWPTFPPCSGLPVAWIVLRCLADDDCGADGAPLADRRGAEAGRRPERAGADYRMRGPLRP